MPKQTTYQPERIVDPKTGKKIKNPNWTKETADPATWAKRHPQPRNQESNPITLSVSSPNPLDNPNPLEQSEPQSQRKNPVGLSADTGADAHVRAGEKDYKNFLDDGLPVFTWVIGLLLGIMLFRDAELGSDIFMMQKEEVKALSGPLASIMNKQKIPARVKKVIISSNDGLAIVAALGVYVQRINATMQLEEVRERVKTVRHTQSQQGRTGARPQQQQQPAPSTGSNGYHELPAYPPGGAAYANI
jgi:hypothetical protein